MSTLERYPDGNDIQTTRQRHTITTWCASMQQTLESAQDEDKEIIVMGDINKHFEGGVSCNDQWQAVVDSLQLTQVITSPTRVTATTETIIDHIYTTHPQHVCASKVGLLSASDHFPVIMIRKCNYARVDTPSVITYRSFKHFHRNNFIYDLLQIPWSEVVKHDNVDDALSAWMAILADVCDKHAPVKHRKVKRKQQTAWLSGEIVAAMQVRDKHKSHGRWEHYRIWRNNVTSIIHNAKAATYRHAIESNTTNAKQMWAHLRDLCPRDKTPTPMITRDGELEITAPQEIANTFNEYFATIANHYITDSTFGRGQHTLLKNFVNEKLDGVYTIPEITEHTVNKALLALNPGNSTGADTISARLLSAAAPAITMPITTITRRFTEAGS